jgi:hypothetical protein
MSTEIIEILEPDDIIPKYGVDVSLIDAAKLKYTGLNATVPAEYKLAIEGRALFRGTRLGIETRRKELNESPLRQTKNINTAAKILTALVEPTEEELDRIIKAADKIRDNAREEKANAARLELEAAARAKAEAAAQAERDRIAAEAARLAAERETMQQQIAEQKEALAKQQRELDEARAQEATEREARLAAERKAREHRETLEREARERRENQERLRLAELKIAEEEAAEKQRAADERKRVADAELERLRLEEEHRARAICEHRFLTLIRLVDSSSEHTSAAIWATTDPNVEWHTPVNEPYASMPIIEIESLVVRLESERRLAREAQEQREAEERRVADLERRAALDARREALKPDCVKLRDFANSIRHVTIPEFQDAEIWGLVNATIDSLNWTAQSLEDKALELSEGTLTKFNPQGGFVHVKEGCEA